LRLSSVFSTKARVRVGALAATSVAAVAGISGILGAAGPASAAPSAPFGSAFVWANNATAASYAPTAAYQWNSTNPTGAVNRITRTAVGAYTVVLPGLGATSGTVLVTAYGAGKDYCKVASWGPSGTRQVVYVRCFNRLGAKVNTTFTLSYSNRSVGNRAYVWANQPAKASYNPAAAYQANSTGATNRITRSGVGNYRVILPNLGASAGHVQVTAYGTGTQRCKTTSWGPSGTSQSIGVRCFTVAGALADSMFTLTYVRSGNLLGQPVGTGPNGNPTAYAWANLPATKSYTPANAYRFGAAKATITRVGTGDYKFKTPVNFVNGNVQVTAYGTGSEHCKVAYWNNADGIRVKCYTAKGVPVNARFDVAFTGRSAI
jgi:hypothetical protein